MEALARDVWWSWTPTARQVFRSLDYPLWRITAHNPVRMLQQVSPEALQRALPTGPTSPRACSAQPTSGPASAAWL